MEDVVNHKTQWTIEKYENDEAYQANRPYEISRFDGNILVNAGINAMWDLVAGTPGTAFNNANAYIGVGDSSTAVAAAQTDLQAVTNKTRKAMETSYPTTGTSQKATWRSVFASGDANYAWEEFAVFNASTAGTMLNRKISSQGTKTSGQTWTLTLDITLS